MPRVCVLRDDDLVDVGIIDWTGDNSSILAARRRLDSLKRDGLFRVRERTRFETKDYYDSVDEWLQIRRDRGATSIVPAATLRRARTRLRSGGSKLVVVLRVRAILFDRIP